MIVEGRYEGPQLALYDRRRKRSKITGRAFLDFFSETYERREIAPQSQPCQQRRDERKDALLHGRLTFERSHHGVARAQGFPHHDMGTEGSVPGEHELTDGNKANSRSMENQVFVPRPRAERRAR